MSCVRSYLVAKSLRSDDGDLVAYPLVGLEVESKLWVVSFNDDLGGLLDGLAGLLASLRSVFQ